MACRTCRRDVPLDAFRVPAGRARRRDCRDCERTASRDRNRARYAADPAFRTKSNAYAASHKAERAAAARSRGPRRMSAEQVRRKLDRDNALRRAFTPEQRAARRERWARYFADRHARLYVTDPVYRERVLASARRHKKVRPDLHVAAQQRRRARLAGAVTEVVSIERVIERDDSTCYLCSRVLERKDVTLDHVIPLARGGAHAESNLRVACRSCNSRKGARLIGKAA